MEITLGFTFGLQEIKKNMKKYATQFELKDRMSQSKASKVSQLRASARYR